MKTILVGLLVLCGSLVNAAASDPMTINVNPKQSKFQITLPSNPTTGYQWTVTQYDKFFLQLISSQYIAPQSNLIGAGGQMSFTFELVEGKSYPATTAINLKYARPWEPENGTAKTVTVNFQSTKP
ncbi:protease inhibitor I42 family protein [Legionella sp.]|uniref:protease inhibitor I42 family protein n=1 Tax=Legionella sp. TaxID=459 RepID=UPI00321F7742